MGKPEPARYRTTCWPSSLPVLLDQIPEAEAISTVTADGACDTRRCHSIIIARGGTVFIPIRKNGRPWQEDCPTARARNETLRATRPYGRAFWKRWTGYHARSRAEAKMRCLEAFGERIAARDPACQTAEIHIRVIRRLSRTHGVRLLIHEPLQRPRHRRDRPRGLTIKGKAALTSQAAFRQNRLVALKFSACRLKVCAREHYCCVRQVPTWLVSEGQVPVTGKKIRNMEEFAAVSGISRPTVSKYFQDPESVRSTTRKRIETALERYDFRPNIFAMNQNRKLTKIVGVVVPYLADPFFAEIARRIERRCIDAGFWPILFSAHGEQPLENAILDSLRVLKPAGVLLAPLGRVSDRMAIERFCADVPTVLFDSNVEGVGKVFVGSDNTDFVTQSVEYLVRTGSSPVLFEMRNPANPNANKRRLAYIANMERLGLEPHIVKIAGEGWDFERIGYEGGVKAIRDKAFPTNTILCSNDRLAVGFLTACFEEGLSVGYGETHAMRVMSHDDHPVSRFTCPPLTTVAHDYDAVSNKAVEVLFHMIEDGAMPETREEFLYPTKLILRKSA